MMRHAEIPILAGHSAWLIPAMAVQPKAVFRVSRLQNRTMLTP
jgi:hypothetical protein